ANVYSPSHAITVTRPSDREGQVTFERDQAALDPDLRLYYAVGDQDVGLALGTSGSMRGVKMDQAKKALKYCLEHLGPKDRFGLIHFATTVNKYQAGLLEGNPDQVGQAKKWVDGLEATGGTAINDALAAALDMRP